MSGAPRVLSGDLLPYHRTLLSGKQRSTIGGKWVGGGRTREGADAGCDLAKRWRRSGTQTSSVGRYAIDKAPDAAKPGMDDPASPRIAARSMVIIL
jgi:hypothetical protein